MSKEAVTWTPEQSRVIVSRGENLLVSAAAGSGKTAVLVERIIRMVTEGEHPLDIDRLLVMTFTNAAASEMRERIGAAIEKKLREEPENEHLQIQSTLIHHAQITTIDSFCLKVIREHFHLLDLDPSFRIGDEGELLLLRGDVMRELLEDRYAGGSESFFRFVETYAQGKSDAGIEDYILQVYTFAQSNPYPAQWISRCRDELCAGAGGRGPWMDFLLTDLKKQAGELAAQLEDALMICRGDDFLCAYKPMLEHDIRQLETILGVSDLAELCGALSSISWDRLATVRSKEVDQEQKAYVTGCRDRVKKAIGKMRELYCFAEPEEMIADMEGAREAVGVLLDLAEEFSDRFREKKRERNLVDFNDLEHEALKVLIREEEGKTVYTEAADELSAEFEQVLVDEYQDSNLVQEALLNAVSGERFGRHNVFMVGDVKQSIYKFRLARPELFLKKYHDYEPCDTGNGTDKKIELHRNFRSREAVLSGINDVFYRIMTENLGNIRYTEETALHPGAQFVKEDPARTAGVPELLVADTGEGAFDGMDEDAADYTAKEIEARMIAARIKEMTDPERGMLIWDKSLNGAGGYRTARYRDIVILLRSTSGWTEEFLQVFMNEGIPAYAESRTGYFNTIEVETMLSLLSVIDNPMQDIPLAAVLKSPIVGMTDEELAELMAEYKGCAEKGQDRGIYGAVSRKLSVCEGQDGLGPRPGSFEEKLRGAMELISDFRRMSAYLPIHELLYRIYEDTGYYHYAACMPAGETRKANLDMLVEKAAEYERTSYKGLFHFIRYIENLKKYNSDFGEASTVGEEDDTVRIMSIHKSKGLEFPIVFLAGMGKKFNRQDVYGKLLIDADLGIATDYFDLDRRVKAPTLKKNVLRRKMELDGLGEELRVLYVAMTRAKEQLIMTATDRSLEKKLEKYARVPLADGQIPYTILSTAGSYLDWILMALGSGNVRIRLTVRPLVGLIGEEIKRQARLGHLKERLLHFDEGREYDMEYRDELRRNLDTYYPFMDDMNLYTQVSVSELKKQGQMRDEEESAQIPGPLNGGGGALRGTAYHRAMELLPFDEPDSADDVERCLLRLVKAGSLPREYFDLIDSREIWRFLDSGLGKRMRLARERGQLHRERQFVIGIPAREMGAADSDEPVIVQGIIDAYFEEDGELILVDYKTDRVARPEELSEHYGLQLDYYARALTQMTGKHVKERIIYSFTLHCEIL